MTTRSLPVLSAALILTAAISLTSCQPSRVYANKKKDKHRNEIPDPPSQPAPAPTSYYSALIIAPTPGFVMQRSSDGRFYHRSSAGFLYWRGYDNRFYLDQSYLHRVRYSQWEYNEWRKYARSNGYNKRRY
jgi:hypothetical protein